MTFNAMDLDFFTSLPECPSYVAARPSLLLLPIYLEQSALTCHVCMFCVCFSRSPQGFPLQAFLPVTFTTTFVVTVQWQLSFSDSLIILFTIFYILLCRWLWVAVWLVVRWRWHTWILVLCYISTANYTKPSWVIWMLSAFSRPTTSHELTCRNSGHDYNDCNITGIISVIIVISIIIIVIIIGVIIVLFLLYNCESSCCVWEIEIQCRSKILEFWLLSLYFPIFYFYFCTHCLSRVWRDFSFT